MEEAEEDGGRERRKVVETQLKNSNTEENIKHATPPVFLENKKHKTIQ